jgi:hypothetical protein
LEIALTRFEYLEFVLFGVEPRDSSNEIDYELEANQILARIAAIEGATRFIPRHSTLKLCFGLKGNGCGIFSRIGALAEKVVGKATDQPLLVRIEAFEAFKSPLSDYHGSTALQLPGERPRETAEA